MFRAGIFTPTLSGPAIVRTVETTDAILLRRTRFGDTSLIITWFTSAHGRLKTAARGARGPKSPFAGKIDLFFEAEIQFARSRKSEVHTLREIAIRNSHEPLRRDYLIVQLAAYFVELLELVTEPEQAAPEIFHLLQRALDYLSKHPAHRRALLHFESELVRLLGIHGQANVAPAAAIGRTYHRLPSARAILLKSLPEA